MNDFFNQLIPYLPDKYQIEVYEYGWFWVMIGLAGLLTFSARFIIQWIVSERKGESVIPVVFWYFSIVGSLLLLSYAIHRSDPVFILSYLFNSFIYVRNLNFIYRKKKNKTAAQIG